MVLSLLSNDFLNQAPTYDNSEILGHLLIPCFFSHSPVGPLNNILSSPHCIFMEVGTHDALEVSLSRIQAEKPNFAVCLTTASAYREQVAHSIGASLNSRFGLLNYKLDNIITCIQEAIMNAVVHGNLGIRSTFKTTSGFEEYYASIEQGIHGSKGKDTRVTISAWNYEPYIKIGVTDQGDGFTLPEAPRDDTVPNGRGLHLMQSLADRLWLSEDRRTIYMTFNY